MFDAVDQISMGGHGREAHSNCGDSSQYLLTMRQTSEEIYALTRRVICDLLPYPPG